MHANFIQLSYYSWAPTAMGPVSVAHKTSPLYSALSRGRMADCLWRLVTSQRVGSTRRARRSTLYWSEENHKSSVISRFKIMGCGCIETKDVGTAR